MSAELKVDALQTEERVVPQKVSSISISTREISKKAGENCIRLDIGQPSFDTPDHVKKAVSQELGCKQSYTETSGLEELRKHIASEESEKKGVDVNPEDIVVTGGGMHALSIAISCLTKSGDQILLDDPCWSPYIALCKSKDRKYSQLGFWDEEGNLRCEVERKMKESKLAIINSPKNPTGESLSKDQIKSLCETAKENNTLLVSDEVYHRLLFNGSHVSPRRYLDDTIVIGSMSKNHAMTGWRIGWIVAPDKVKEEIEKVAWANGICASNIGQKAAIEALKHDSHVQEMREEYDERKSLISERIEQLGWEMDEPSGGMYVFPDTGVDSEKFCNKMLQNGVAMVPGKNFGTSCEKHVRICFGSEDQKSLKEAFDLIEDQNNL
jgi:aspartate aminotransferase